MASREGVRPSSERCPVPLELVIGMSVAALRHAQKVIVLAIGCGDENMIGAQIAEKCVLHQAKAVFRKVLDHFQKHGGIRPRRQRQRRRNVGFDKSNVGTIIVGEAIARFGNRLCAKVDPCDLRHIEFVEHSGHQIAMATSKIDQAVDAQSPQFLDD